MLTLHGSTNHLSVNTLKIRAALADAGAAYEYRAVDLAKGEQRAAAFLAINPHGKIPVLSDDGFHLAESNAILFYVAETFPAARLLPPEPQGRARALGFCDFASISLYAPYYDYLGQVQAEPGQRILAVADKARANLDRSLAVLETLLATREHLAGPFSIADYACASVLRSLGDKLPDHAARPPATAAWFARVTARPGWQKALVAP